MENIIKILINEHDSHDIELLQYQLKKGGINFISQVVQTKEAFEITLSNFNPDIILSDFNLPTFDGLTAFQIKQKISPEIPFIFISGTIGEEKAVELIKNGATDYVLKERMFQVPPKVIRALNEISGRKQKITAEQQLKQREEQLQKIMNLSLDVICTINQEGNFVTVGAASQQVWAYLPQELIGRKYLNLIYEEDKAFTQKVIADIISGMKVTNLENRCIRKDGKLIDVSWSARWDANEELIYCVARDASEIKAAEEKIKNNEKRFRTLLQNSTDGLSLLAADGTIIEISATGSKILGYEADEILKRVSLERIHPEDLPLMRKTFADAKNEPDSVKNIEYRFLMPDGNYKWIEASFHNQLHEPAVRAIVLNYRDITEKKLSEIAIRESEERYRNLFHLSPLPKWVYDIETLQFLNVNEAAIRHYGYSRDEFLAMTIKEIRPQEDIKELEKILNTIEKEGTKYRGVAKHIKKSGELIYVDIQSDLMDIDGKKSRLVLAADISERFKHIQAIEAQNKKLRDIAWIQSHIVRAPVARIKGLIDLLNSGSSKEVNITELLNHLLTSANELDDVIRTIINKTEQIEHNNEIKNSSDCS